MPKVTLTDLAVQQLKLPTGNQVDYWDKNLPSFGVRVAKGGTKSFVVLVDRKRKKLGEYPNLSLKDARAMAKRILYDRVGYEREQAGLIVSYAEAVERYLKYKEPELRASTFRDYTRLLGRFDFRSPVHEIKAYEVADALDRFERQTDKSHAFTVLKVFFGWCLAREYCQSNPLQNLKKPKLPPARDRVLSENEMVKIWLACQDLGKYGAIVRLLMLTGQREGQIARLQTSWVDNKGITFPAEVMKNKQKHWCPLGKVARMVLLGVTPIDGYYFTPPSRIGQPFSAWSKNKVKLDSLIDIDPWRLHDLRRTWSTTAAQHTDTPPDVVARVLSHTAEENKVWRIYNRHDYRKEMMVAMDKMETCILSWVESHTKY